MPEPASFAYERRGVKSGRSYVGEDGSLVPAAKNYA